MADTIGSFPIILNFIPIVWNIVYLSTILTTSWVIMKGFRGYLTWHMKLLVRIGLGSLALLCTISLVNLLPVMGSGILKYVFNIINFFAAGVISTIILTVSVFLISNKIYNIKEMENSMNKLRNKIMKAKSVEKDFSGKSRFRRLLRPINLSGIVVLTVLLLIALSSFRGFPDHTKNVQDAIAETLSEQGVNSEMLKAFCSFMEGYNQTGGFSDDCAGPLELVQSVNNLSLSNVLEIGNKLSIYVDSSIESLIESSSGQNVEFMYRIEYKQRVYALALTSGQSVCSATGSKFCGCVNMSSFIG